MIGLESDKKFQANSPRKCTRLTHFSQMSWSFHFVRKVFVRQNLPTGKFWLSGPLRGTPSNINLTIILKPYITDLLWTAPIWQSSIFINIIIIIVVHVYHSEYHPNSYDYNIIQFNTHLQHHHFHHSHHYQWFRQENFLTTLRVGHQMNFSSIDANFLSINIIFISIIIINSNIISNTYVGVNWRSGECLEIIESELYNYIIIKAVWKFSENSSVLVQWPVPQRGIIELASTKVLKYQDTRKNNKGWSSEVVEKSSERDYWIGRDWSGAAGNVCCLLRKRRAAIRAFVFHNKRFLSTFIVIILVSTPARFGLPALCALSTCGEKRSRVERQLSHGSGPVGNCVEIIKNDLVCRARAESITLWLGHAQFWRVQCLMQLFKFMSVLSVLWMMFRWSEIYRVKEIL